ncbi:hypothetical protein BC936DRAFT_144168, partial [Jimgerdemannia flammicorona]
MVWYGVLWQVVGAEESVSLWNFYFFFTRNSVDFSKIGRTYHPQSNSPLTHPFPYLTQTLQRAQHKTFNSPRIQRHLFNALIRLGEYEEAELALRAYLALTGHAHDHGMDAVPPSSHSIFPMTQGVSALNEEQMAAREREREKARERERENDAQPLTPTTTMAERGRKMSKSIGVEIGEERENDIDVVEVLIAGVKLMCKEMAKGEQAVEFAELAMIVWERGKGGAIGRVKGLKARVWRVFGIAYGMLASQ